jgi:hypothetical protein
MVYLILINYCIVILNFIKCVFHINEIIHLIFLSKTRINYCIFGPKTLLY